MATVGMMVLVANAALGYSGHHAVKEACCDTCGVETAVVLSEIQRLLSCPNWRARDNAAHRLRKFAWRCHPEIPAALSFALLHDGEEEVREESAQSLTK